MNYGRAIKIIRSIADLQQNELAGLAKIDPSHISLIESGKRRPSVKMVERIGKALRVPTHLITLLAAEEGDLRAASATQLKMVSETLAELLLKHDWSAHSRSSHRSTR